MEKWGLTENSYNKIKEIIEKYNNHVFKIFGSRARGDHKKGSDIDLIVEDIVTEKDKFNIKNDLDMLDIPYQIDIVFKQDIIKLEFLEAIERDGKNFYE